MKNFTLKLCLIFTILSICATSFADVVFKFKTPSDWSKCHIWAWDDDNTQLASTTDWPGDAAMTLSSDGYYTYTLKTSVTKVNFLFNNGASSGTKQTVDASTTKTKFMGRYQHHAYDEDQGGDDAGYRNGDGGDHLALLGVGADTVLLQSIQRAGQLQIGNVTGDEA